MHSVSDPSRVRFTGSGRPVRAGAGAGVGVVGLHDDVGDEPDAVGAAHLSRWMQVEGVVAGELTEAVMDRFLSSAADSTPAVTRCGRWVRSWAICAGPAWCRRPCRCRPRCPRRTCCWQVRRHLRAAAGADSAGGQGLRALGPALRPSRCCVPRGSAGPRDVERRGGRRVPDCPAARVVTQVGADDRVRAAVVAAVPARRGDRAGPRWPDAVPTVASWRLSGLPQALTAGQVQMLLDACDRRPRSVAATSR